MESIVFPFTILYLRLVRLALGKNEIRSMTLIFSPLGSVSATEEFSLCFREAEIR